MSDTPEPRTYRATKADCAFPSHIVLTPPPIDTPITLVEKSAYDELQRERDELEAALGDARHKAESWRTERDQWKREYARMEDRVGRAEAERDEAVKLLREMLDEEQYGYRIAPELEKDARAFLSRRVVAPER